MRASSAACSIVLLGLLMSPQRIASDARAPVTDRQKALLMFVDVFIVSSGGVQELN